MSIFAHFGEDWTYFGLFSTLIIFLGYDYGGIDAKIIVLSPSCKILVFFEILLLGNHMKNRKLAIIYRI